MINPEKRDKLILAALIVFIILLIPDFCFGCGLLSECMSGTYPFIHKAESFDDVTIELVTVELVPNENDEFFHDTINSVKVIAEEDKEAFLEEFRNVDFILPFGDPISKIDDGKAFCFTWPDGQTEVATTYGCELYTDRSLEDGIINNGNVCSDDEDFYALWDKWAQS